MNIDAIENERKFNEAHGIEQEQRSPYRDRTIVDQPYRKILREKYENTVLEKPKNYIKKIRWEEQQKQKKKARAKQKLQGEVAKQDVPSWVQSLNGREIEKPKEYNDGLFQLVDGYLTYSGGRLGIFETGLILF